MDAFWIERPLGWRRDFRPLFSARGGLRVLATPSGKVRLRRAGSGKRTVVFVCDTPVFIEHYDRLFELLAPEFGVLCLELPGMGLSRPARGFDYGLESQARAVREVLEAEAVSNAILAFSCVGAYLAWLLAAELPTIVHGVISIQAPCFAQERTWARRIDFRGRGLVATPLLGQLLVSAGKRRLADRWFQKALGPDSDSAAFAATAHAAFDAGSSWALASLVQAYFGGAEPTFTPIEQKALVLWGDADRSHRHSDPESALPHFRNAELLRFDGAGHCPELEQPVRFARAVQAFSAAL
jgi:pimeloyl-ACP methyl ester carboxylesterase